MIIVESWHIITALASLVAALVGVAAYLRSGINKLEDKIDSLSDKHVDLSNAFYELRGEVRARFAIRDATSVKEIVEPIAQQAAGSSVVDR